MEQIAETTDARRAWDETPNGRQRLWCKDCRDEGEEWLNPEPCEHILNATPEQIISRAEAMERRSLHILDELNSRITQPSDERLLQRHVPVDAENNSEPQFPKKPTATRPTQNADNGDMSPYARGQNESFYDSDEWRQTRIAVLERDNFTCQDCREQNTNLLVVHHIVDRKKGGPDTEENLKTLCHSCHNRIHLHERKDEMTAARRKNN